MIWHLAIALGWISRRLAGRSSVVQTRREPFASGFSTAALEEPRISMPPNAEARTVSSRIWAGF